MLLKFKRPRSHQEDRWLAVWLATTAGLLNAIALGAFGFFPSHMTGNTSQLSREVSTTDLPDIVFLGTILLVFFCGATCSRLMVIWGEAKNLRTIFCQILLFEGGVLAGLSLYELYFPAFIANREIIVVLCFLMGVHNSISSQLSNGRVRATHITGTLTDVGIASATVLAAILRSDHSVESQRQKKQIVTHSITIGSFLMGGIAGLVLFQRFGLKAVTGVGVILIAIALSTMISVKKRVTYRSN